MKQIINGKTYNTKTAIHLAHAEGGTDGYAHSNDFAMWIHDLYRTQKGAYFLLVETFSAKTIVVLTEDKAKQWAEEHISTNAYIELFGEPEAA